MIQANEDKKSLYVRVGVLTLIVLTAAFSRMVTIIPNFSPMGAITIFAAAYFTRKWQAFFIPLAATFISDFALSKLKYDDSYTLFYNGFYFQYIAYALIALSGLAIFKKISVLRIAGGATLSTIIFFLVSNFGSWVSMDMYSKNFAGLLFCYEQGLEHNFLRNSFAGDFLFVGLLFGTFEFIQYRFPSLRLSKVKA